mmetsp:Transcript_15040/g.24905  ORF Transcript_15040/g.24905 Transcript_15040/m.24905 type:complete len:198 (-) Transcript_15040:55-648(-)|eukprot:CAMPEP_0114427386 /NCGR_PEP_ID=MMETSP0103-20121206/8317_1 /TAXON_ID=37642 ORGANISM="Paraphysomonas imperforata, Strain PA2" /NCGR_SAMPLE_ID=MMETSP0103 /ASSEMBLY_ACC=CAM_ASM_000201 /LENGTH=197 /DNA_ID=CAMNT_0001596437 /DNA_START=69 /DNA_END=662 /DNA_ORIENTATION=-
MKQAQNRIKKELEEVRRDPNSGVSVEVDEAAAAFTHFFGVISGPDGTPYAGGVFRIDISIPSDYPFSPPKMKFETKVWHPNVSSQTGAICLDILKDQWSPALTIKTALLSVQSLLCSPEPSDPQDAQVANMYMNDPETFAHTAKFWTDCYASAKGEDDDAITMRLVDMGFPKEASRAALIKHNGDENAAVNELIASL